MGTVARGVVPGKGGSHEVDPGLDDEPVTRHVAAISYDGAASFDDTTVVRPTPGMDAEPTATAPTNYPEANLFDDATLVRPSPARDEPAVPLLLTTRRKAGEPSVVLEKAAAPGAPALSGSSPPPAPAARAAMPTLVTRHPAPSGTGRSLLIGALCVLVAAGLGLGLGHLAARRAAAQGAGPGAPAASGAPAPGR